MRKVYQRFCTCSGGETGSTLDPDTGLWVHAVCGYPKSVYYLQAVKDGKIRPLPRDRWGKRSLAINIERYRKVLKKRTREARARVDKQSTDRGVLRSG